MCVCVECENKVNITYVIIFIATSSPLFVIQFPLGQELTNVLVYITGELVVLRATATAVAVIQFDG